MCSSLPAADKGAATGWWLLWLVGIPASSGVHTLQSWCPGVWSRFHLPLAGTGGAKARSGTLAHEVARAGTDAVSCTHGGSWWLNPLWLFSACNRKVHTVRVTTTGTSELSLSWTKSNVYQKLTVACKKWPTLSGLGELSDRCTTAL